MLVPSTATRNGRHVAHPTAISRAIPPIRHLRRRGSVAEAPGSPAKGGIMRRLSALLRPSRTVYAHCDLPCGVYDPAQARIEAESIKAIQERYEDAENKKSANETADQYQQRALDIKEQRADLVKHHLWVLWTDYFKPNHLEQYPQLHDLFWKATKAAGDAKRSVDPAQGQQLLDSIAEIDTIFWETKKA
jgi:nickel superoxide dismutase